MSQDPVHAQPQVIHQSAQWMVLSKPNGWNCVAVRESDGSPCIEEWLRAEFPQLAALEECGLVHRLDRTTSGCLIVALNREAQLDLRERFSSQRGAWAIGKCYLALVRKGTETSGSFSLYFSSRHKRSAKVTVKPHGTSHELGECRWQVVRGAVPGSDLEDRMAFDLLSIDLVGPGRRHQIRAGMAKLGHPLAGDLFYGGDVLAPSWNQSMVALHSWRIELDGVRVESPAPAWAR